MFGKGLPPDTPIQKKFSGGITRKAYQLRTIEIRAEIL